MLPKSLSLFMLIVAIQFSQNFAAPQDGWNQDEINTGSSLDPAKELLPEQLTNPTGEIVDNLKPAEAVENISQSLQNPFAAIDSAQLAGEQFGENAENVIQSVGDQVENGANSVPSVPATSEKSPHLSHQLTREQELEILHRVPEFKEIIQAMEKLPDDVYVEMKNFLESTVKRMPKHNLFTQHFKNAEVLVHMFERLIKAAKTGAIHEPATQDLFDRVHKAAPAMKREMDQFHGIMDHAQSRIASLGTSTNPMDLPTSAMDLSAGSVSLPVEEKTESFASEIATPAVANE